MPSADPAPEPALDPRAFAAGLRHPRCRSDCPVSSALDLLGDKWSLLVMRDVLLRGKAHYREFLASEEHIATNILADRLSRLEAAGCWSATPGNPAAASRPTTPPPRART